MVDASCYSGSEHRPGEPLEGRYLAWPTLGEFLASSGNGPRHCLGGTGGSTDAAGRPVVPTSSRSSSCCHGWLDEISSRQAGSRRDPAEERGGACCRSACSRGGARPSDPLSVPVPLRFGAVRLYSQLQEVLTDEGQQEVTWDPTYSGVPAASGGCPPCQRRPEDLGG